MKRKFANRPDWERILEKTYTSLKIEEPSFCGWIGYLSLDQVRAPLWVRYGTQRICIVDDRYVWLQYFPDERGYVMTAMFNTQGELVQAYYDIVKEVGLTPEGVPYCDDLYLDVVALPNGEVYLLDEDELLEALQKQEITQEEFDYAHSTAASLMEELKQGRNYVFQAAGAYYRFLRSIWEMGNKGR